MVVVVAVAVVVGLSPRVQSIESVVRGQTQNNWSRISQVIYSYQVGFCVCVLISMVARRFLVPV